MPGESRGLTGFVGFSSGSPFTPASGWGSGEFGHSCARRAMVNRVAVIGGGLAGLAAPRRWRRAGSASRCWSRGSGSAAGPGRSPTRRPASSSTPASTSAWAAARTSPTSSTRSASATCSPRSRSSTSSPRTAGRACSRPTRGRRRSTSAARFSAHTTSRRSRSSASRGGCSRSCARSPDADPPLLDWLLRAPADPPHHRPVLGRGAGRAR